MGGGGGGALSIDNYNELHLTATLKIQRSTDSNVIATFADCGPTFGGGLNCDRGRDSWRKLDRNWDKHVARILQ